MNTTETGNTRVFPQMIRPLVVAQLRRTWTAAMLVPVVCGALVALAGACWAGVAGAEAAAVALFWLMPLHLVAVGVCAAAVLTGDRLVEVQASTPVGFRAVQTARLLVLLSGAAAGAFAMFAPMRMLGIVHDGPGWAGALAPVVGAMIMVLVSYVSAAFSGSARAATFAVVLAWLFFALVWDPNIVPLCVRRGAPLLAASAAGVGAWRALAAPDRVFRTMEEAR